VWLSDDSGDTWTEISGGLPQNRLYALAFAGPRILVGGGFAAGDAVVGVYASDDSGTHWQSLSDASWPLLGVSALAVAPDDPLTIVVATEGRGINRSTDGGATWQLEVDGTARVYANSVRFAGTSDRVLVGAMSLGVLDSADRGADFAHASTGLRELFVPSIAVNPLDADELAAAFQSSNIGGVYASTDRGAHWTRQNLPPTRYSRVAFSPTGVLHAISSGPTSATQQEGLYRRNADATWTGLGPNQGPSFESDLESVLFSADDPNLILLGGKDFGVAGFGGTIWRSASA
jgi:photosystem II stability/assembly factor-like uncharacterized protein